MTTSKDNISLKQHSHIILGSLILTLGFYIEFHIRFMELTSLFHVLYTWTISFFFFCCCHAAYHSVLFSVELNALHFINLRKLDIMTQNSGIGQVRQNKSILDLQRKRGKPCTVCKGVLRQARKWYGNVSFLGNWEEDQALKNRKEERK